MRRLLASSLLAFVVASQAAPASTASVETLLELTQADKVLGVVYAGLEQNIRQGMQMAVGDKQLSAEQDRAMRDMPSKLARIMREELSWETLKPLLVPIYVQSFEQDEIDGLIQFYKSPLGRRLIEKQPLIAQRSAVATQQLMTSLMPKLQAAMQSAIKEAGVK